MFRIRRIYDYVTPTNREVLEQVKKIIHAQFPLLSQKDIAKLPEQLRNPLKYRFRSILFVAESSKRDIKGFALLFHEPIIHFCYLDFLSAAIKTTGAGIGGALYNRVREEALYLGTIGIFYECLPDDPKLSKDPQIRKQNAARLRFYERYGARPVVNTLYETPLTPGDDNPPYLVYDNLGKDTELNRDVARTVVRAILERKYETVCPRDYIEMVVQSFKDDPVQLRKPLYLRKKVPIETKPSIPADKRIALTINDQHIIHHIQELGYVESPVRIDTILKELETTDLFQKIKVRHFTEKYIKMVHDSKLIDYFKKACSKLEPGKSIYPYVFPIRYAARPPKELPVRAGYYCIDTFTPLNRNAFLAAKRAVDCTLTAAQMLLEGYRLSYALVRPPGHHAERHSFGGFCYLNSAAIAAEYLSSYGKIAMVDIDYHHGNGQQNIFYKRPDVLTISIHGHPNFAYPYFSGFSDEKGIENGKGYNINYPMPENISNQHYFDILNSALRKALRFRPQFLIIPVGFDTARGDPTGTWGLEADDFERNGKAIGALHLPTLIVQEGGYDNLVLGVNARSFLTGLWQGAFQEG